MPVQIGAPAHSFSDPTGLLSDCHRRIESFLATLEVAADRLDTPLTAETRSALDAALRYFREAAPKHTADEEESLFPRLRQMDHPELGPALENLAVLEKDHRWAESLHDRVDTLGRKYLSQGPLSPSEVGEFREALARLKAMYAEHIRVEDTVVFPAAARLLPESARSAIAGEMAARRRVKLIVDIPPLGHSNR